MNKVFVILFITITSLIIFHDQAFSQCRTFSKKKCAPTMEPYIHDGQINSTLITEGESIELYKTFYEGQDYRVLICAGDELDANKVRIRLLDHNRKVLYDNQDHEYTMTWDFIANSTQQVIIEVSVPKTENEKTEHTTGCISILIGFLNVDGLITK
jgi:hypothetical protein